MAPSACSASSSRPSWASSKGRLPEGCVARRCRRLDDVRACHPAKRPDQSRLPAKVGSRERPGTTTVRALARTVSSEWATLVPRFPFCSHSLPQATSIENCLKNLGAGDGNRTHDIQLGKLTLHQVNQRLACKTQAYRRNGFKGLLAFCKTFQNHFFPHQKQNPAANRHSQKRRQTASVRAPAAATA